MSDRPSIMVILGALGLIFAAAIDIGESAAPAKVGGGRAATLFSADSGIRDRPQEQRLPTSPTLPAVANAQR
jgi:hypothetical protein